MVLSNVNFELNLLKIVNAISPVAEFMALIIEHIEQEKGSLLSNFCALMTVN